MVIPSALRRRMQTEATDSTLREGIEALGVQDTELPATSKVEEDSELPDTDITAAPEEDTEIKEKGNLIICNITKLNGGNLKPHTSFVTNKFYNMVSLLLACLVCAFQV